MRLDDIAIDLNAVEFQDCIFGVLELASDIPASHLPRFTRCYIARCEGRTGEADLPHAAFVECTFDEFENTARTTNAILSLAIPLSTRVMLTVLKKLYAQSGNGRKESALFRGLDLRAQQIVPEVLQLLKREGLATRSRQNDDAIWLPVRGGDARRRVLRMLAAPAASNDPALAGSRQLET
jgi:hypothetical protein